MPRISEDGANRTNTSSAVARAFAVLRVLRRAAEPLPLTRIAAEVGIAPSSAHSILNQLLAEAAIMQDGEKRYALGPSVFYIGSAYARSSRIYRSIWMELVSAANELAVTVALAVPWEEHHLVIAAHRAGDSDVAVPFGGRVPLAGGSWGKVYYAWSGTSTPATLERFTATTITDPAEWQRELELTREKGYAVDREEFSEGTGALASPITSSVGYEGLASMLAPIEQVETLTFEALGRRLSTLAARASLSLGDHERVRLFGME